MIKDLAVGFQQAQQQFPSIVQDNYKLKEGIYIRLNVEQSWESQSAAFDQNHLIIRIKEDEPPQNELLNWFKRRDYFSSLISMNKPVDSKKQVHGNNPFSLFVKRDVFLGEKQGVKFTMSENINRFLLATDVEQVKQKWLELVPTAEKKGSKRKSLESAEQSLDSIPEELMFFQSSEYASELAYLNRPVRTKLIEHITQWYRNNISQLTEYIAPLPFKNYVKLFFALNTPDTLEFMSCEQIYSFEYVLYTIPKIYNNNDYNQIVNEDIVGLPSYDMTMNAKKPFMEHKTMQIKAPDRVSLRQAILAKEATEWLATQPKYATNRLGYESGFVKSEGDSPLEGTLHIYMDGKSNELFGFENVPFPPTLSFKVEWLNSLQLKDSNGDLKYYGTIIDAETLQKTISGKFFRGRMNGSFVLNEPDVKNKEFTALMVALFIQSRQAFHDWIYKGTIISLRSIFAKVTLRLLEEQLIHVESARMSDLADAYNLRLSVGILIDEEGGKSMADRIEKTVTSLRDKVAGEGIVVCSNDEEFYYMAGQLAFYLTSQSKAEKKTGEIYEPFLRAKNGQQLKKRLEDAYMLYKHEISSNYRKFNHAFSMVMGYVPEQGNEGSSRELLLAGLFADNLMFEKSVKGVK